MDITPDTSVQYLLVDPDRHFPLTLTSVLAAIADGGANGDLARASIAHLAPVVKRANAKLERWYADRDEATNAYRKDPTNRDKRERALRYWKDRKLQVAKITPPNATAFLEASVRELIDEHIESDPEFQALISELRKRSQFGDHPLGGPHAVHVLHDVPPKLIGWHQCASDACGWHGEPADTCPVCKSPTVPLVGDDGVLEPCHLWEHAPVAADEKGE